MGIISTSDFDDRTPPTAFGASSAGDSCRVGGGRRHEHARERSHSLSYPLAHRFSPVVRRRRNPRVSHRTLPSVVRVLASSRRVGFAGKKIIARTRGPSTPCPNVEKKSRNVYENGRITGHTHSRADHTTIVIIVREFFLRATS